MSSFILTNTINILNDIDNIYICNRFKPCIEFKEEELLSIFFYLLDNNLHLDNYSKYCRLLNFIGYCKQQKHDNDILYFLTWVIINKGCLSASDKIAFNQYLLKILIEDSKTVYPIFYDIIINSLIYIYKSSIKDFKDKELDTYLKSCQLKEFIVKKEQILSYLTLFKNTDNLRLFIKKIKLNLNINSLYSIPNPYLYLERDSFFIKILTNPIKENPIEIYGIKIEKLSKYIVVNGIKLQKQ